MARRQTGFQRRRAVKDFPFHTRDACSESWSIVKNVLTLETISCQMDLVGIRVSKPLGSLAPLYRMTNDLTDKTACAADPAGQAAPRCRLALLEKPVAKPATSSSSMR